MPELHLFCFVCETTVCCRQNRGFIACFIPFSFVFKVWLGAHPPAQWSRGDPNLPPNNYLGFLWRPAPLWTGAHVTGLQYA